MLLDCILLVGVEYLLLLLGVVSQVELTLLSQSYRF